MIRIPDQFANKENLQRMERMLYEASLTGDVNSLKKLLEKDPLILDRSVVLTDFYETPLHIAALRGHILSWKPELASEVDLYGFCPLHVASVNKNLEMVQVLLDKGICMVRDQEGRTPLHLAAMKGRIDMMKVLIAKQPNAIHVISNRRRETILHLCVKHNRMEALNLLMDNLKADIGKNETVIDISDAEKEFISANSMDNDGNTILHLAVARRHIEMIQYLIEDNIGIEINALNNYSFTALDTLAQIVGRDIKDVEIGDLLRGAGALRAKDEAQVHSGQLKRPPQTQAKRKTGDEKDWLKDKTSAILVAASLMATLAFQAGLSPPGGVWQDDSYSTSNNIVNAAATDRLVHYVGRSILAQTNPTFYLIYMVANTLAFTGSLTTMALLATDIHRKQKFYLWLLVSNMFIVSMAAGIVYTISVISMTPSKFNSPPMNAYPIDRSLFLFIIIFMTVQFFFFTYTHALTPIYTCKVCTPSIRKNRGPKSNLERTLIKIENNKLLNSSVKIILCIYLCLSH
ncbi:ankyrin repeat-containing protein BDA1-like [Papaver somniferum]|uniref:ankyrin repeat-containing protein BDA1-like n=1 Tax=Papaver somniferum TaxID=3469 RepID=UPI000E6FA891|nr:ankyrin repeat-containing protein BDA1-like [Papaver somniferum]